MKKIAHISASQISTFKRCPREWYYNKILGLETKKSAGAELGSKCHEEIEEYLTTGVDNRSELTKSGDFLLKLISKDAEVERELNMPTAAGVNFTGFIDIYDPAKNQIVDHKFKASLAKYGTSPEELEKDIQAVAYSRFYFQQNPDEDTVTFAHHEHQTKEKAKAQRVEVTMSRSYVDSMWEDVETMAADMVACGLKELDDVPYNVKSCWAFGGCSFMKVCKYSPRYEGKKGDTMSLLDKAKLKKTVDVPKEEAPKETVAEAPKEAVAEVKEEAPKKKRATKEAAPVKEATKGYELFIDCFPTCGATDLAPLIKDCANTIAKNFELLDVRLAEGNSPLAYGKWKAALSIDVMANIPEGRLYISRGDLHDAVLDALCAGAKFVVRPLR